MVRQLTLLFSCMSLLCVSPRNIVAEDIQILIENTQSTGGFFFTPVWLGFHDGGFDLFDLGSAASSELATQAETGDPGPLSSLFSGATNGDGTSRSSAVITAPSGFLGAPVFEPGESVVTTVSVPDVASNRYLSLSSMVIPSNDAFLGNGDPLAYMLWDADGTFAGPLTIEITGSGIYDSGSEVNDAMGAAFSALGGTDTDEDDVIAVHPGLDNFVNTATVSGAEITSALGADEVLARITVRAIPEPSSLITGLAIAFGSVLVLRRKR